MERVETETERGDVSTKVLVQPAVEQRVDARRRHREPFQGEVCELEVTAADYVMVQLGN